MLARKTPVVPLGGERPEGLGLAPGEAWPPHLISALAHVAGRGAGPCGGFSRAHGQLGSAVPFYSQHLCHPGKGTLLRSQSIHLDAHGNKPAYSGFEKLTTLTFALSLWHSTRNGNLEARIHTGAEPLCAGGSGETVQGCEWTP